ncbi:MAG TPA: hypothetical protein ENI64_09195 [Gammaproteobacteria bacterium]|nr:hypothetical protein [Gammaproteobacteria bacterium]
MTFSRTLLVLVTSLIYSHAAVAVDPSTVISMETTGTSTFYVKGEILGMGPVKMMVDTGSGYSTINEETLDILKQQGKADYVKDLTGILANGDRMVVKVYSISAMNIGNNCWLKDIEVAVFPGKTRQILGLSALKKTSPFTFSVDPPELALSNCVASL